MINYDAAELVETIVGIVRLYANENVDPLDEFYDSIGSNPGPKKRKPFFGVTARQIAFELHSKHKNKFPSFKTHDIHVLIRDNEELLNLARAGYIAILTPGDTPCWYKDLTDVEKVLVAKVHWANHFPLTSKEPVINKDGKLVPISKAVEPKEWVPVRKQLHREQHIAFFSGFTTGKASVIANENISNAVMYRVQQTNVINSLEHDKTVLIKDKNKLETKMEMLEAKMSKGFESLMAQLTQVAKDPDETEA